MPHSKNNPENYGFLSKDEVLERVKLITPALTQYRNIRAIVAFRDLVGELGALKGFIDAQAGRPPEVQLNPKKVN